MSSYKLFALMFEALDAAYDKSPNVTLGDYLSGLNPYLFVGEGSADPAEYENFKDVYEKQFSSTVPSAQSAYLFCQIYLQKYAPKKIVTAFSQTPLELWTSVYNEEL